MQLEIKTTIDAFNPNQVKALNDFLTAIGKSTENELEEQKVFLAEKQKQTRKKAEKIEAPQEDVPTETPQQEQTKPESIEVVEPETVSAPTLMQIRSLVAQKAGEHKDSIKSKLVELGAQNVSTLDAKHFQTIFDFLNGL